MEQQQPEVFLCVGSELSLDELRKLMDKTIRQQKLSEIQEFQRVLASVEAEEQNQLQSKTGSADSPDIPHQIRHNISVDVSRFSNFETALKRFTSLCRNEGLMPKQRQFEAQGERMKPRYRTGRFERTVFPVSPLVSAVIRDRKRKAGRGELQETSPRTRVKPREIVQTTRVVATPIASPQFASARAHPERSAATLSSSSSRSRFRYETGPRDEVLIIIEFLSDPPKFSIIKDEHKALIGFPFGGKDDPENGIVDASIIAAALREAREEFFFELPVILSAGEENIIATMPGPENGIVHIVHLQVPAGTPYAHGKEQTDSAIATEQKIDELVADRLILPKHKEAWGFFKEIVLLPRFLASLRSA